MGLVAQYCCDLFDLRDKHIRFKHSEVNEEIILSFLIKHEKHMHDLEVTLCGLRILIMTTIFHIIK